MVKQEMHAMKKLIVSAGLVSLGAASLHAAYAPGLSPQQTSKWWSVSAALRGFYDDNYTTRPSNNGSRSSFGIEASPSFGVNLPLDQTYIGFSYTYSIKWYEDRESSETDQSHQINLTVSHAFTERVKLDIGETFVVAQEPEILEPAGAVVLPLRSDGDNFRNTGTANLGVELTDQFSVVIGYSNTIYDYEQDADDVLPGSNPPVAVGGLSRSALLDRMEQLFTFNFRWQALPQTVGVFGYQYGITDYTSDDVLFTTPAVGGIPARTFLPESRDKDSHYVYVGADQNFNSQLNGSVRLGAQFTDYDLPGADDRTSPYADANLSYNYTEGSYAQIGVRHELNATDVAFLDTTRAGQLPTVDQESTTVYGVVNHKITAMLSANLFGQFQHSEFNGGLADGSSDNLFLVGVNLGYQINQYLTAETGYSYDRLDSDASNRSFSRNRVYIGMRAQF